MRKRKSEVKRVTKETGIQIALNLDGNGKGDIKTGIGFLDHMLTLFSKHGHFDLNVRAKGDLTVDIHHTNEDIGICLGEAFRKALGKKFNIRRYGYSFVPMDEALAHTRVVLDISGRPSLFFNSKVKRIPQAEYTLQDAKQFLQSFSTTAGINMHVDVLRGEDSHHIVEAIFKATARALRDAVSIDRRVKGVPSTKGKL